MKVVYVSVQSSDAGTIESPAREICAEKGWELDLFYANSEAIDNDPLLYNELVRKTRVADLVLIRCMSDPVRMKRFERFERDVLRECPGYVMVYSGSIEVKLLYRELFKGDDEDYLLMDAFLRGRGADNDKAILCLLNRMMTGTGFVPEPQQTRANGIYHPDFDRDVSLEDYLEAGTVPGRPTVGLMYPANLWVYGNLMHIDTLIRELEAKGLNVIPVFFSAIIRNEAGETGSIAVVKEYFMDGDKCRIDALVMASPFSQLNNSRDCSGIFTPEEQNFFHTMTNIPVIQAMSVNGHYADYEETATGLSKRDITMSVIWPEVDGQIITVPIASNEQGYGTKKYTPLEDRIRHLADMVHGWAVLSHTPRSERRVAILMYQSRPESGRIGNAAGLDTIESVNDMLKRYAADGYTLDHVPENGRALIDEVLDNITNDLEWSSPERIRERAADMVDVSEYMDHYSRIPEFNRNMMEESWGKAPGNVLVEDGRFVIPGLLNGNIFIGYQPLRSWADQMEAVYHDPVVPMPHQYLMFYRWLKHDFKANVVLHMGTHGSLEWLPGKSVGLSGKCFPDLVLDGIPHIYPYVIDDPGEGIQCKRRSEAVLIGHMCPTMSRGGTYDEIAAMDTPLQEYFKARTSKGEKLKALVEQVMEGVRRASMFEEMGIPEDVTVEDFEPYLEEIHDYITEIKDALVRDGLHILGRAPEGERLDETIYSMMRLRNGDTPSLRDSYAAVLGYDMGRLLDKPSGITNGEVNGAIIDGIDERLMEAIRDMRNSGFETDRCLSLIRESAGGTSEELEESVRYVCETLSRNLMRMTDEMDNLMLGCDGGYVLPGPSGAPTRGNAHILPMGRNYYGIDPDIVPPPSSWPIGRKMADQMIQKYVEEKGCYPREVGFVIWATDTMKTNGDDVAYILWLMGVRPVWSSAGGQVVDLEVIPLEELGRPRIDVTVRITGLFRDAFPNLIDLIDDAVRLVADLDEDEEDNYLAANLRKDIVESVEKGLTVDEARRQSSVRIFGCPPGAYGPGVNKAIESSDWKTVQDLAEIYIAWGSYAYGRGISGESMRDQFMKRFSKVGVTVKNMPDREIDLLDIDDVYGYLGGMNSFIRVYGNPDAMSVMGDGSNPDRLKLRDTKEELQFVYRSKILNPRFIEGLKQHGYRGVSEIANLTEFTFGWDATSDIVDDWVYEKLTEAYLFDKDTREWMMDENPHAMMDMMNRLMEAYERGMWNMKSETLEKMRELYLDLEERIEEVNDKHH